MGGEQKNVSKCQPLQRPAGLSSNCHHREADGSKILPCGGLVSHAFYRQKDVWNCRKGWTRVNEKKDNIQQSRNILWQKTYENFFSFIVLFCSQPLPAIYKFTWTQSTVVRLCSCPAAVHRRLLHCHLEWWWYRSAPPSSPSTWLEQIKWTQWFLNQITRIVNRLTFLREVLFPLSLSLLFPSPKPEREREREREWRPTNFNLHYLLWFLC